MYEIEEVMSFFCESSTYFEFIAHFIYFSCNNSKTADNFLYIKGIDLLPRL